MGVLGKNGDLLFLLELGMMALLNLVKVVREMKNYKWRVLWL